MIWPSSLLLTLRLFPKIFRKQMKFQKLQAEKFTRYFSTNSFVIHVCSWDSVREKSQNFWIFGPCIIIITTLPPGPTFPQNTSQSPKKVLMKPGGRDFENIARSTVFQWGCQAVPQKCGVIKDLQITCCAFVPWKRGDDFGAFWLL